MATMTKKDIGGFLARQGILVAFALFIIGFTIANPKFLTPDNILSVVRSSAILGVMALGVTFVVISGNLDLSVGSMMSFSTIVVLDLHDTLGPTMAIPAMFAMTLALGALIGFLVGYLKLNSLIVTLGMLSAIHGLTLTYSGGKNMDIADKFGHLAQPFVGQGQGSPASGADPDLSGAGGLLAGSGRPRTPFRPQGLMLGRRTRRLPRRFFRVSGPGRHGWSSVLSDVGRPAWRRRGDPARRSNGLENETRSASMELEVLGSVHSGAARRCMGRMGHDLQDRDTVNRVILGFIQR